MLILHCSKKLFKQITFIPPHKDKCRNLRCRWRLFFYAKNENSAYMQIAQDMREYSFISWAICIYALGEQREPSIR